MASSAVDFDEFYRASARRVLLHVYVLTGDRQEAQDIVQEAYVRTWQRWSTIAAYQNPEAWTRMVASRLAVNRWRRMRRWLRAGPMLAHPETTEGPSPDRVAIVAALRELPEAQRLVVALYYLFEQPIADIARDTGMPVGTVKAYLSRARTRLAGLLGESQDLEDIDVIAVS